MSMGTGSLQSRGRTEDSIKSSAQAVAPALISAQRSMKPSSKKKIRFIAMLINVFANKKGKYDV